MGKVRRLRKKYHLACQKADLEPTSTDVVPVVESIPGRKEVPVIDSNIFAGLTISLSDLQQTLLPPTTAPVLGTVSEASVIGSHLGKSTKHVNKKDKRAARREALLCKIDTVRKLRQAASKRPKKSTTPKPMLMTSLFDALPTFSALKKDSNEADSSKRSDKIPTVKPCPSKKKRKKMFIDNMKTFKSILSNKHYKADPASAISNYLLKTVAQKDNWSIK